MNNLAEFKNSKFVRDEFTILKVPSVSSFVLIKVVVNVEAFIFSPNLNYLLLTSMTLQI